MTGESESEPRQTTANSHAAAAVFEPSAGGWIRHWLIAGPKETPYAGPPGAEHVLRRQALDYAQAEPPPAAVAGGPGPFPGSLWHFHDPGRNEFVEFSTFYRELTVVEYYASTELAVSQPQERRARLWAAGAADLWVNGEHLARFDVTRSRYPDSRPVTLKLRPGNNRLCVRLQCLGVRDTRMLLGVQLDEPADAAVLVAGGGNLAAALRWIDGVRVHGRDQLESPVPAPLAACVVPAGAAPRDWPAGARCFSFAGNPPTALLVKTMVDGVALERQLEIPGNRPAAGPCPGDRRAAHLRFIAKAGLDGQAPAGWNAGVLPLLARRLLGQGQGPVPQPAAPDQAALAGAIAMVDARRDCADFVLAGLLRMELLGLCLPEESAAIRRAALAFRYWPDEPGNDAMCFHSENHSLLFSGCQLLAGRLYRRDLFSNCGRNGEEQAARALPRIGRWLEKVEARGFEEFNSSTYMPITVAAMLNLVDFSGDPELSARCAAQIDRILRDLAQHCFGGGVISPQGRVYRDVLFPEDSGTQALLAWATEAADINLQGPRPARERAADWVVFPASSLLYHPPADLAAAVRAPAARVYRHADVQITLEKTPAYLLTALAVPAPPRSGEAPDNDLRPGGAGYQQHLWQATLGRDCHVFVNHPGGLFDGTKSRPGYWHGSGLLPRVRQEGNWLHAIHVIADGTKSKPPITPDVWEWAGPSTTRPFDLHPVAFVHAHWPTDAFDRQANSGHWKFGQKGRGLIGLWCSERLVPHDDVLTGREFRANSYASAWLVICADLEQAGSLETFMANCAASEPCFDRSALILTTKSGATTRWWERTEPMPQ